jgi:threonine dehydratase
VTGSFKERGALNALLLFKGEAEEAAAAEGEGVAPVLPNIYVASAGNHALAVAFHGARLGFEVHTYMPVRAPLTKVSKCSEFGAVVTVTGANIAEARTAALAAMEGDPRGVYLNGFDDPKIIAGAGTIGIEILSQVPNVDAIVVPVGGGGLIAGIALSVKSLRPECKVYGVEPNTCASMTAALAAGEPTLVRMGPTLADGLAVPTVGSNAFEIVRELVDDVRCVSERWIALAILRMVEEQKMVVEGAGVLGMAALLAGTFPELKGKNVVTILCGGNIDTPILGRVLDRGLAVDGRLCTFTAQISDTPGSLAHLTGLLASQGVSVKDLYHERVNVVDDVSKVNTRVIVETRDLAHTQELAEVLEATEGITILASSFDTTIEAAR